MKRFLIVCSVLIAVALSAQAADDCQTTTKKKTPPAKKSVVTGSYIPVRVDKDGRPVDSTLKVMVLDEKTFRLMGLGDPGMALARLPMVYGRGGR